MPVKIKIFAVAMAVMCLMSCMCMTAFADESAPTSTNFIQAGVPITIPANANDKDVLPILAVTEGITYTFTCDNKLRVLGWNGTSWVTIGDSIAVPYEYTADGTYTYLGFSTQAYSNDPGTLTAMWDEPGPLDGLSALVTAAIGWVATVAFTCLENPILLVFTVLPLIGLGVGLFVRLKS